MMAGVKNVPKPDKLSPAAVPGIKNSLQMQESTKIS